MRFPAPDRFKFNYVAIFAAIVFAGQLIEGTDPVFAVLTCAYTLIWAAAFNVAGGIRYPSGAFIFFNGFLNVVVGLSFKVMLGEPGERNLTAPTATMFCYCVGVTAMLAAAFVCREIRPARGLLPPFVNLAGLKQGAIVCLVGGILVTVITTLASSSTNPVITALRQINKMPTLAIMLATTHEILHSKGKRAINWVVITGIAITFAGGLVSFGKEGMLIGFAAWFFAAVLQGYDFSKLQLALGVAALAFFSYYLVPYSQYVRGFRAATLVENEAVALHYLADLNETRRLYTEAISDINLSDEPHLYDHRQGFLDRLIVLPADDALIAYTNKGNVFGLSPTVISYSNLVPRFIWHNKPIGNIGNGYAHELGWLAEEDLTTGIAFSATADGYHQAKWLGLLLVLPIDIFLFFIILDSVVGSAKWAPWAFIPILDLSEIGPDGGLDMPIYTMTYGVFGIVMIFLITRYVAPAILKSVRQPDFGTIPAPLRPALSAGNSTPVPQSTEL